MIKERFIEQYGLPQYTVGLGSSGGAMQQHLIAHNYPGLLDALTPVRNFPDLDRDHRRIDCGLLNHYFDAARESRRLACNARSKVDGYPVNPRGDELHRPERFRASTGPSHRRLRCRRTAERTLRSRD